MTQTDLITLQSAIQKFGELWQIKKAKEELFELLLELRKITPEDIANKRFSFQLIDEISDCVIMLTQLKMIIGPEKVQERIEDKVMLLYHRILENRR